MQSRQLSRISIHLLTLVLLLCYSNTTLAQAPKIEGSSIFVSVIDQEVTIQKVTFLPALDNISGIYAKPLEEHLKKIVSEEKQWSVLEFSAEKKLPTPESLEENSKAAGEIIKNQKADGLFTLRVTRGPGGVSMRLNLFSGPSGIWLAQESITDYQGFETEDLKTQLSLLYKRLRRKMPYQGILMSRTGNEVTVNIGSKMGVRTGDELTVVQVFKINRHPKFKFVISSEKEILGILKVTKAEETLSFANISTERDVGVLRPGMKVLTKDFVIYPEQKRPDPSLVGEAPPPEPMEEKPTFGRLSILGGLGIFTYNTDLETTGSLNKTSSQMPTVAFWGELWVTPQWIIEARVRQSVLTVDNPMPGSSPSKLNVSLGSYSVHFGYNLLLKDDFFGPKFQMLFGMGNSRTFVDSSTPIGYTSTNQGGVSVGLRGTFPWADNSPYAAGAELFMYLSPSLTESPSRSGSAKNPSINQFGAFLEYKVKERMRLKGTLSFDMATANFRGNSDANEDAESLSQKTTLLMGGVEFLF